MHLDHVSFASEHDGLQATAARISEKLGIEPYDGGVHPRFGTRNLIFPLADGHYLEVVEALEHFPSVLPAKRESSYAGWVSVSVGCNNTCTFCIVPSLRGKEIDRRPGDILAEVKALADQGVSEITLLGQNVNGWHGEGLDGAETGFGDLIRALADVPGLDRIRYTTSHPNDMADDLIAAHRDVPQLMPYLHLPVQSGSDRILRAMNRKHTADQYLRLVGRIREARPDILMTSDFIVGFPGETDEDHAATLRLVEEVGYGTAFSFKYSPRPGTPAAGRTPVEDHVADARLQELQALLTRQQKAAQDGMVGRTVGVLFEKPGRLPGQLVGKSDYLHSVFVDAPGAQIGDLVPVRIRASAANSLAGDPA